MKINNCEATQKNVTQQLQIRHKATPSKTQSKETLGISDVSLGKGEVSTANSNVKQFGVCPGEQFLEVANILHNL